MAYMGPIEIYMNEQNKYLITILKRRLKNVCMYVCNVCMYVY